MQVLIFMYREIRKVGHEILHQREKLRYPRFPRNPSFQPDRDFSKKYLDISYKASMQMLDDAVRYKSSA